ncbi:putative C6 transcription factor [Penicillium brasilianum]|uniref:Putative C6 transcription factor n=1 Tax=Penicillium brasilianum TaxID=104259 RepID=A0A1S9RI38_PENBI|nr:putative C6 transcription factor [Penicillium brasilianum]
MADVEGVNNALQPDRPRKRRRRTMACTQCRSRKLRCDREYPTCTRCLKSRTPTKCTYEDGFLWQQPTTVTAAAFTADQGSGQSIISMPPRTEQTEFISIETPPDSGIGAASTRSEALVSTIAPESGSTSRPECGPHHRGRHLGKERGFLETVLGAPKAAVNQEPYVNTGLLQRPKRPVPEESTSFFSSQMDRGDGGNGEVDVLSPSHQLDLAPRMMMRGRETKTRFSGSGIFANVVAQFPDIRAFAEEIRLANPILSRVRPDLERVKRGLWKRKPLNEPFPEPTLTSLISLLPARPVVDELIGVYLTYIESTHRIFHVPTFLQEVDEFWRIMDNPGAVSAGFVVQLLLVLACAWNLADVAILQEKSATPLKCYIAVEWVLHAEKWIDNAHIKRLDLTSLRLYILQIMAQNCFGMKRSKAWLATSTLVKQAMLSGYHRDPDKYARISIFNKEMRRRIWMTIVELDLQVAIDRGMPPSVQTLDYDTLPPLNIDDDEIHEGSIETPADRPLSEITDSSFQCALSRSFALRLKACHLMHSPRVSCRYEEIQRLDWELNRQLSRIPQWTTNDVNDIVAQHKITLWKATVETKLAQSLLSIHTPFAIESRREPLFSLSARSRLDAATMILSTQKRLHETSQSLSLCMLGEWTLQAYISMCQVLHTSDHQNSHSSHPSSSVFLLHTIPGLPDSLLSLVETVLVSLEARFMLVVKGAKDYFFLSTIVALVKAKIWPTQAAMYKQQVVERILSFAQTLFTRHANCEHLGKPGMGSFQNNQVASFIATPGMAPVLTSDIDGILPPPNLGIKPPGDFDPFLDVFDWEDLTGIALYS